MIFKAVSLILQVSLFSIARAEPSFEKDLEPFLKEYCVQCHGKRKQKGDFRLDELSRQVGVEDAPLWHEVMGRISSGEMPPEDEFDLPTADQSAEIVEWIAARLKEGESERMAKRERVSYFRLTREEYVNTMRDLIGVEYDATDPGGLLEDPEWNGFERLGSVLTLSPTHIEKYLKAAETVLSEAYPEKPVASREVSKRASVLSETRNQPHYDRLKKAGLLDKVRVPLTTSGEAFRGSNPFRGPETPFPGPGVYEISYTVSGLKPEHGIAPRMHVYEHQLDRVLFEQDIIASEDQPVTVTFRAHLPHNPQIHVFNHNKVARHPRTNSSSRIPFVTTADRRAPWQMKITDVEGRPRYPILIVDSISMRGPIVSDQEQAYRNRYMASDEGNMEQVREGLGAMAKRAFRRPLREGELDRYVSLAESEVAAGESFVNAVKSAMTAILCSKSFLFLEEGDAGTERHRLNDWELASRLSYLLWSTMPDEGLFTLAEQGKLRDRGELQAQFRRMLHDPRAERFSDSFSSQWLHLRKVGMFPPDKKIYPNYDQGLEGSMIAETQSFFGEVLHKRLTLREFIDSNWTMMNPRLARFYGMPEMSKDEFQQVSLKGKEDRGGLLTQASILSLTSDGTRHRPVHRGAWLSEVILGKTPPPPPANVDPIEPNPVDEPKATLRMKLDAHKHDASCASCHQKIDPLGFAFENFNAIGQWRTHEKVEGTGKNPPIDASGVLPDGRKFSNAAEFKNLLMDDLDLFNEAFVEKLAIYGLRRTLTFDDHDELAAISKIGKAKDYRVTDLVEAFVLSDLFQKR
ncbi:MAG: hypothetical protein ACJAQT_001826 [Akkermansiaceae bacterium]|jgi:hypothetical protein